jgi:hypothetical protein
MRAQIRRPVAQGITTEGRVEEARKALDTDIVEFIRFQEAKSLAVAEGRLATEEGQPVYPLLGNTPGHFNRQDAATKAVLTRMSREMLERGVTRG